MPIRALEVSCGKIQPQSAGVTNRYRSDENIIGQYFFLQKLK
jgi:hypothetical protein